MKKIKKMNSKFDSIKETIEWFKNEEVLKKYKSDIYNI